MIEWMKNNICPNELGSPEQMLKESFRLLRKNGKIFIVDWKKEGAPQEPPRPLRCSPEEVKSQLISVGFEDLTIGNEMSKHFLVIAEKR
jgi:hypothetical protein